MKRTLFSFFVITSFALGARAAIDFTPMPYVRELEGMKFPGLTFRENGRPVTYEQPRGWNYSGGGARIRFNPPNVTQAQAEIDQTPLKEPQNLTEEVVTTLRQKTLASVPANSTKVELVSETLNPFAVNGHETYELVVSYELSGQAFLMGIVYVNLPDAQLRFRTISPKASFEKVHGEFRGSIFSLQWQ